MTQEQEEQLKRWKEIRGTYMTRMREFLVAYKTGDLKKTWRIAKECETLQDRHHAAWEAVNRWMDDLTDEDRQSVFPEMFSMGVEYKLLRDQCERVVTAMSAFGVTGEGHA